MLDREGTYITSIEKTLQVTNFTDSRHNEAVELHPLRRYNTMFFVIKNYSNAHQPLDLV